jgi:hypothetical protein
MRRALYATVITLIGFAFLADAQNRAVTGAKTLTVPAVLVIQMPEPSSPALLGVDLLSVGALALLFRRRAAGPNR